jgi:hypothetical protein
MSASPTEIHGRGLDAASLEVADQQRTCSICADAFARMPPDKVTVELPACGHIFCHECLKGWWSAEAASRANSCPDCRRVYSGLRRCVRSTAAAVASTSTCWGPPAKRARCKGTFTKHQEPGYIHGAEPIECREHGTLRGYPQTVNNAQTPLRHRHTRRSRASPTPTQTQTMSNSALRQEQSGSGLHDRGQSHQATHSVRNCRCAYQGELWFDQDGVQQRPPVGALVLVAFRSGSQSLVSSGCVAKVRGAHEFWVGDFDDGDSRLYKLNSMTQGRLFRHIGPCTGPQCPTHAAQTNLVSGKMKNIDSVDVDSDSEGTSGPKFNAGDVVWAKVDGYPWWPARVNLMRTSGTSPERTVQVSFFGDNTHAWLKESKIVSFDERTVDGKGKQKRRSKTLTCAMQEAVKYAHSQEPGTTDAAVENDSVRPKMLMNAVGTRCDSDSLAVNQATVTDATKAISKKRARDHVETTDLLVLATQMAQEDWLQYRSSLAVNAQVEAVVGNMVAHIGMSGRNAWRNLTKQQRIAAASLGWGAESWDADLMPNCPSAWDTAPEARKGWEELTDEGRRFAALLHYTLESWDKEMLTGVRPSDNNLSTSMFIPGEIANAFDQTSAVYACKILRIRWREAIEEGEKHQWEYFVHYNGWNSKFDEWVTNARVYKMQDDISAILAHESGPKYKTKKQIAEIQRVERLEEEARREQARQELETREEAKRRDRESTRLVLLTLNSLIATIENEQRLQSRCERGARQALDRCIRALECKEHKVRSQVSLSVNSMISTIEKEECRLRLQCERGARQALEWCVREIEKEHRLQMRCERGARQALEWCVKKIQKEHRLQLRCERGAREALERCVVALERSQQPNVQPKIPETWDCEWSKEHSRWFYWKKDESISTWTRPWV